MTTFFCLLRMDLALLSANRLRLENKWRSGKLIKRKRPKISRRKRELQYLKRERRSKN
jgi:hypothetical protein